MRQSSRIDITYFSHPLPALNYLIIEDDGLLPYSAHEISQKIHLFSIHDTCEIYGVTDKRYKTLNTKKNEIVKFCNELKIGSLRLGQEFIFIASNVYNEVVVFFVVKESVVNALT